MTQLTDQAQQSTLVNGAPPSAVKIPPTNIFPSAWSASEYTVEEGPVAAGLNA